MGSHRGMRETWKYYKVKMILIYHFVSYHYRVYSGDDTRRRIYKETVRKGSGLLKGDR